MALIVLIGLGAGAASGLLFASVASGAVLSMLLFYMAPLPLMIAALGWSHWAGLIGALAGASGLALAFGGFFFITFLVGVGLPGWWLAYLALLARPAANAADGPEWYPVGRLVVWAALLGCFVVIVAIPNFGLDEESFRTGLRRAFERLLRIQTATPGEAPLQIPGLSDPQRFVDMLVIAIPFAAAILATITNIVNLWLAGRIVRLSGHLARPWPDLSAMTFPAQVPVGLALAIAGSFLPSLIGTVLGIVAAALLIAYAILGFAVLHAITRRIASRSFVLAGAYAAVLVFGWPAMLLTLLGLADTLFDLRGRLGANTPPTVIS